MAPLPSSILHTASHRAVALSPFAIAVIFLFFLVCFYFSLPDTLPSAEHEATHTHDWSPYANIWTIGFLSPQHSSGTPQSIELRRYKRPYQVAPADTFGVLVSPYDASLSKKEGPGERQTRGETVTLHDAWRGEECLEIGVGFSNIDWEGRTVVGDDGSYEDGGRGEMTEPFPEYVDQFLALEVERERVEREMVEREMEENDARLSEERERVEREEREMEGNDARLFEEKWRKWRDEKEPHTNLSPLSGCVF